MPFSMAFFMKPFIWSSPRAILILAIPFMFARAWFQRFSSFLLKLGFYCSRTNTSLFVFTRKDDLIYVLIYVDDIILTGNNPALINQFISQLNSEFAVKDLGLLNYFLGLEVSYIPNGFLLSQVKYATDILVCAQLLDSKPITTPMIVSQ